MNTNRKFAAANVITDKAAELRFLQVSDIMGIDATDVTPSVRAALLRHFDHACAEDLDDLEFSQCLRLLAWGVDALTDPSNGDRMKTCPGLRQQAKELRRDVKRLMAADRSHFIYGDAIQS